MTQRPPPPLVLASSSPFKRDLLSRLGVEFSCRSPDIDESALENESIPDLCVRLAEAKARALARRFPGHLLIGCDQSAAVGESRLHKPGNFQRASSQLKLLSGRRVSFYTAVAVLDAASGRTASALDATEVWVRTLNDGEIRRYLEAERPFNCAGSFKVEGLGISLFEKVVSDDPTALIGLPMIRLCELLREAGYVIP